MNVDDFPFIFGCLISFSSILFSVCKSFTSLVKFIPKYFTLSDAIICNCFFLVLSLDCSLLLYRKNMNQFCEVLCLILNPVTLQKSFIGTGSSGCLF